uniref:Protein kinase domain-containing protein n=1 Tax=Caenorhabditis tropicalis TaxID=1561998 RepID=A0A1I7U4C2_9PELO
MYTEARIMRALSHPNIIKLEGVIVEKIPIMLVIEYLEGSCLSKALIANKVPNETRFPIVMGMLYGLQYMHQHGFIHRDIAARNVMVSNDCRTVKIIDFGLAKHGLQFTLKKCSKIPAKWLAPEILDKWTFTPKSDTWAFGVCIWEIYHDGAEPYADTPGFKASSSEPEGPQGKTPTATTPLAKTPNAATPAGSTPTNAKNSTVKRATKTPKLRPELMITKNAEWVPQDFMPIYKRMHDINVDRRIELSAMAEEIEKKILPTLPPAVLIEAKIHMEKRPPFDSKFKVDLSSHLSKGSPSAPPSKGSKKAEYVPINKTARRKNPNQTRSRSKSTGDSTGPSTGTTSSGSNPGHKSADKTHTKRRGKKN